MTIAIVCDVLGRANNGTTIAALNLIRYLTEQGHTVRVVCPDEDKQNEPGYFVTPRLHLWPFDPYLAENGVILARADVHVLERALDGADALHIMTPFTLSRKAIHMAMARNIPITAGFHCQAENFTTHICLMNARLVNFLFYRTIWNNVYRYVDCIHYPTQFICDTFEKAIAQPTNHYVISNGVNHLFCKRDVPRPAEFADRFVIHFTGRMSKEKSHRVLIRGAARSKYRDKIQLVFAGDGPQKKKLIRYASKLPNPPIFRFFSREELVDELNAADLYVHPAEIEIEAIACLEAISCGLVPVISDSPRSATRFFALDARNLFRCNDADDLAARIDYWIEHPEERAACSKRYQGYAQQCDFDNCMAAMEDMIRTTAARRKGNSHGA